jgi:aromatic ring-opening dioxygenase LigB subunit
VKEHLRKTYGNFGYRYTLSRSFDDVIQILIQKNWVQQLKDQNYRLTSIGMGELKSQLKKGNTNHYDVAAYGRVTKTDLLARFENGLN